MRALVCICGVFVVTGWISAISHSYGLAVFIIAVGELNRIVIDYIYIRLGIADKVIEENHSSIRCVLTFYYYINVSSAVKGIENKLSGVFDNYL